MLDADEHVLHLTHPDKFVELDLDRGVVAILRILNQEDHQEGDNRRPRIDDELPGIGISKHRPRHRPDYNDRKGGDECRWPSCRARYSICKVAEHFRDAGHGLRAHCNLLELTFSADLFPTPQKAERHWDAL